MSISRSLVSKALQKRSNPGASRTSVTSFVPRLWRIRHLSVSLCETLDTSYSHMMCKCYMLQGTNECMCCMLFLLARFSHCAVAVLDLRYGPLLDCNRCFVLFGHCNCSICSIHADSIALFVLSVIVLLPHAPSFRPRSFYRMA